VCALTCLFLCLLVCLCVSSLWRMNVCACAFSCVGVHLSVVATVCLHLLNQIYLKVKYLCDDLFMLPFPDVTYNVAYNAARGQLLLTSDMWHSEVVYVCVNLCNMLVIALRLSFSMSTCVFRVHPHRWLLCTTFACSRPVFLHAVFCTPITRKKGTCNMQT